MTRVAHAMTAGALAIACAAPVPARAMRPSDVDRLPESRPTATVPYGTDPLQRPQHLIASSVLTADAAQAYRAAAAKAGTP